MFRRYPRARYGLAMPYAEDASYADVLAQGEDLFISAHGSPSSVGHPLGEPRFGPGEMAQVLE